MTSIQFNIQGMSCAGCAQSIERRLQSTAGVQSINVDLASATAALIYDESVTNAEALEKVIEALGFNVMYSMKRE
ncbi:MAG TPA: heavy metal-associated domain-containing protein [Armatimonadota bacterium]